MSKLLRIISENWSRLRLQAIGYLLLLYPLLSFTGPTYGPDSPPSPDKRYTLKNVAYGPDARHYMDVALPKNRSTKKTAVLIFIHGGAWVLGNKLFFHREMEQFADSGFACVCINYRFVNDAKGIHHREITSDILRSITFIRDHAQKWNISADKIGLIGHSAGGHMAMIVAYTLDSAHLIKAVVSWSGPTNFLDPLQPTGEAGGENVLRVYAGAPLKTAADTGVWKSVSPYYTVKPGSVPTLLVQGEMDNLVPYHMAVKMQHRLDSLGVDNDLVLMKNAGHLYVGPALDKARKATYDWMKEKLADPVKIRITRLTGDYYIYTTWSDYKGHPVPANGMYLVTRQGVVLMDTPWDTTQCKPLMDSIWARHQKKVVLTVSTHSHGDRTGGLPIFQRYGIPTYTSFLTDEECIVRHTPSAAYHFLNDTSFQVGEYTFQTYFGGGGHTRDNIVVWFPQGKVLYGGCMIKSTEDDGLGYVKEANLTEWPLALQKIKEKFPYPAYVIPGHGGWTDPNSLDHTLQLLKTKDK